MMKIAFSLGILLLMSCDPPVDPQQPCTCGFSSNNGPVLVNHNLIGKWQWHYTCGGFSGDEVSTLACSGDNSFLTFTPDSMIIYIINGDTVLNSRFYALRKVSILSGDSADMYTTEDPNVNPSTNISYHFESNKLMTAMDAFDGSGSGFIRVE